ncbi:hypothetical protein IVA88_12460 [Bradyrhizobium sp. 149]|uniref:glycoside hydrolase family 55 protein n=1 Tax=Bradyrhizobium sp. 149 TaxID=2782624 RepID=UPI001FFAB85A|nr:glycoside hydrolase family 55 protein [Bradyrhizobium sp. 149]MCK1652246.1 hypothetical protein [Bradyrhizobium sp. 149]
MFICAARRLLAALLLLLLPAVAAAQTFPTVPPNTVIGRTGFGSGPASAIPFSTITATLCNLVTPTVKGCVPPPVTTTGRYFGDDLSWHAVSSQQVVAGTGVTLGGTCAGTSLNCTVNATAATQLVVSSRADAITRNLSLLSAVRTLGYATTGDGGGATFQKITSGNFTDSFVTSTTTTSVGVGCTNGTYNGVFLTGGNGTGLYGIVTIAGNVMTSFAISGPGGNAYVIGDVLTIPAPGGGVYGAVTCTTQPTVTVAAVTAPSGSFTDVAGTKFQYVPDGAINVRQFGAVGDYNGTLVTNDAAAIQRAINFASRRGALNIDAGGYGGDVVYVPKGAYTVCGGLSVYGSVALTGAGKGNTVLKQCDTDGASQRFITLGDPNLHFACFYTSVREMLLYGALASANSGISMIYSNCQQQGVAVLNVAVYTYLRECVDIDTGYGGASDFTMIGLFCSINNSSTNPGVKLAYSAAVQTIRDFIIESSSWTIAKIASTPWCCPNL